MVWGHWSTLCVCACVYVCGHVCVKLAIKIPRILVSRKAPCINCNVLFFWRRRIRLWSTSFTAWAEEKIITTHQCIMHILKLNYGIIHCNLFCLFVCHLHNMTQKWVVGTIKVLWCKRWELWMGENIHKSYA